MRSFTYILTSLASTSLTIHLITMPIATTPDAPISILLTDEERDSGIMGDKKLFEAIKAFHKDGLVVVENAIDVAIIDKLNERMLQDTERLLAGAGQVHFHTAAPRCLAYADGSHLNKNVKTKGSAAGGNLSQVPPLIPGTSVF